MSAFLLRLPKHMAEQLSLEAGHRGLSRAAYIRTILMDRKNPMEFTR
jgi:predicted DNA-binding protein